MSQFVTQHAPPQVVVACEVMAKELEAAAQEYDVELVYLDQGLHRTPDKMPSLVQEKVDQAGDKVVGLGYGLCSMGIQGVKAGPGGLIAPRAHDCMALFMGGPDIYQKRHSARPGTYYLTSGWIEVGKDPLTTMQEEYTPRYGKETAEWAMREEIKNYTHFSFLNTGVGDVELVRQRTRENASFFDMEFEEAQCGLDYFKRLMTGPYPDSDFIILAPGQEIAQAMYF